MRLDQVFASRARTLSFEFFPPKNERAWYTLEDTIEQLVPLGPDFVSVTYGAGGSTRAKTREVVEHIQRATAVTAMAHLTCVNATTAEITALLDEYHGAGIENLLALRGDPPKGQARFIPTEGGPAYASDLIAQIRADGRFSALCAAFPEGHPEAPSREADWERTAQKIEAGAAAAITQLFFDPADYLALVAHLERRLGRRPRVIPGILPITDAGALERICARCGASVPPALAARLRPVAEDRVAGRRLGMSLTIALCRELLRAGAPGLHLYAFNRSTATAEIVTALRESGDLD
jgi:methylenetetrahydrofolate reductase (NADPH)